MHNETGRESLPGPPVSIVAFRLTIATIVAVVMMVAGDRTTDRQTDDTANQRGADIAAVVSSLWPTNDHPQSVATDHLQRLPPP